MKKVVWPSAKQVRNNLVVVLVFVALCAALIFALDFIFGNLLRLVLEWSTTLGAGGEDASSSSQVLAAIQPFISLFRGV